MMNRGLHQVFRPFNLLTFKIKPYKSFGGRYSQPKVLSYVIIGDGRSKTIYLNCLCRCNFLFNILAIYISIGCEL